MSEWNLTRLGDVISVNANTYSAKDNWEYVNYLDTGNITENHVDIIQRIVIGVDKLPSRARRKVRHNSIVYSAVRPNQRHYGILKNPIPNLLVSTGFVVIDVNEEVADADFVYYMLSQDNIVTKLQAIAEQSVSTYPTLKPSDIENLMVELPDIETQRKSASILQSISKKEFCNRRINDNLWQQIFTLYRGKYQYPSGNDQWRDGCIGDVLTLQRGYDLPKDKIIKGIYPVAGSTDTIAYHANFTTEPPCIVMGRSGNIGRPRLYLQRCWAHNTTLFSKEFKNSNPFWVYAMLCNIDYDQFKGGSAVPTLNRNHVHAYPITIPPQNLQDEFGEFAAVLFDAISKNTVQNEQLCLLRDTILPKLMSGELDVAALDI